ncbi:MAG: alpha/beta hydrolase [Chloroflexota bacterium]
MARRLGRAALRVVLVLLAFPLIGVGIQAWAEHSSHEEFPAPGKLVEVGGGQVIHLRTWGDETNGPTIILDVSCCQPSSIWAWVARDLSTSHRVVAYDRPGMAWSLGPSGPRHAESAAGALTAALAAAGIGPPFVVIGHSYGGLSARVFAGMHRDEVRGVVLLDTTHPDGGGGQGFALFSRLYAWKGHSGLLQLSPPPNDYEQLPTDEAAGAYAASLWTTHLDATAEELEAWDLTTAQARAVGDFGDLPLLVASVPGPPEHLVLQRDLLRLSSNSTFVELNASHMGMLMDHDQAAATVTEIKRFLDSL